jgi:predicted ATPase
MLHYIRESSEGNDVVLTARLGVSQGDVVAGYIGRQSQTEFAVTGKPVQQAKLLAKFAPPGSVWVSREIRAATERGYVYASVPSDLSDLPVDLSASELVGARGHDDPQQGPPKLEARLVGREVSLQAMTALSQNLSRGTGGLIWIEGESGIGKSRLMQEFGASMAATGALVWTGRCSPQRSNHPFSLFSSLLGQVLGLHTTDALEQIRARINEALQTWPPDTRSTRPYLEMLSGVRPSGLEGDQLASLEPDQLRQQMFVALRCLLKSLAAEQPLVMLLDDLHWVDPMSARLLLFLSNLVTSTPVLFVCAQSSQEAKTLDANILKVRDLYQTQTVQLHLDRLSVTDGEMLLRELFGGADLPAELCVPILEQSDGNPYFIQEFVRMHVEQGLLQYSQGHWEISDTLGLKDLSLPASLEALIRSRVDALHPEFKRLLQCAAVIGRPFEIGLLEAVCSLPDVKATLIQLESRGMLRRVAEADHWEFSHPLIATVVYDALLKTRRKSLHLRIAQVLEDHRTGVDDDHTEELAHHFTQADEGAKALSYLVLAGEQAAGRYANEEALIYFGRADQQLVVQPEAADALRWRIAVGLGDAHRAMGKYAESMAALEAALPLVETKQVPDTNRAGLYRRLGETAQKRGELDIARQHFATALDILDQPTERESQAEAARVLTGLAWTHFLQGDFDQALLAAEDGLKTAQNVGHLATLARAENVLGGVHYRQGNWNLANQHAMRAMVLREQIGHTWGVALSLSNLGVLAFSAGHWAKAVSFFERSLALRQELGDVEGIAIVHGNLGAVARDRGRLDLAESHFRESLNMGTELNMAYHIANATLGLAHVFMLKGEVDLAQESIGASLAQAETIGAQDLLAEVHRIRAEILMARETWGEASEMAKQSASVARETGNRVLESAAWRVASECALRQDDGPAARESLARAQQAIIDVMDELEAGRVVAQAGRLSLYEGDSVQAEKNLQVALGTFKRLRARLDVERVEYDLNQLSISAGGASRSPQPKGEE